MKRKTVRHRESLNRLVLLLAFFMPLALNARLVPLDRAQEFANLFWAQQVNQTRTSSKLLFVGDNQSLRTATRSSRATAPLFYVFAGEDGHGFVILSAEDSVKPVLGYSFEDKAPNLDNLPPALSDWLEGVSEQISAARQSDGVTRNASDEWNQPDIGKPVILLETAKWNQLEPFNNQVPMDGDVRCVAGCVPVAAAIVMHYHQWPVHGVGVTKAYKTKTKGIQVGARDLNHRYHWDRMLMDYSEGYSQEDANEISTLIADIGYAFSVDYADINTGTYGTFVNKVIVEQFGFDSQLKVLSRSSYSQSKWYQILKDEFDSNRPIIYRGANSKGTDAHMFVLDGYTTDNYFHVNWGWGGYADGYFAITNFRDYNLLQLATIGLKPNEDFLTVAESTSFSYDKSTCVITLKTKPGVSATLFSPSGAETKMGLSQSDRIISIDAKKLTSGKHRIKLQKGKDVKELEFLIDKLK